jgi:hypothetical protein
MSNRLTLLSLVLGTLLFVSGCSNRATATLSPGADLSKLKTFYVVHQPKDTHSLHNLISDKLVKEGYSATAGPPALNAASRLIYWSYVKRRCQH